MTAKSTKTQYGSVVVTIHWLSALLIIAALGTGFRAGGMEDAAAKVEILRVHIPLAITVLFLTIVRILWWLFADKKPDPIPMPRWQDLASRALHFLFYVVILGMIASGIGMIISSGAGPAIFDGANATLPDFWNYKPRVPHGIGARAMFALLLFHAGAALYHQFIKRDGLLRRMWF